MRLVVSADLAQLEEVSALVLRTCSAAGLDDAGVFALRLTVEELFVNVVTHGFREAPEPPPESSITIRTWIEGDAVMVSIRDAARAFDPTAQAAPDNLDDDLADREAGGLGVHLVRNLMDVFTYRREDGYNLVTVGRTARKDKE